MSLNEKSLAFDGMGLLETFTYYLANTLRLEGGEGRILKKRGENHLQEKFPFVIMDNTQLVDNMRNMCMPEGTKNS